jgi:hypothetical protein
MSFMLKLPDERGKQLRQIAAAKNTTIPEVIAGFVRAEIANGTIPATVPGIEIGADGPNITIKAKGFAGAIPATEGPILADLLKGSATATADTERKKRWIEGLAALSGVKVKRTGNGVKLVSPFTDDEYPLSFGVAADLADQIKRTAQ